jgi:hypothetical protein
VKYIGFHQPQAFSLGIEKRLQIQPCKLPHRRIQPKHNAHGPAALVRLVAHPAVVREGCGFASGQLGVAHKEVDVEA